MTKKLIIPIVLVISALIQFGCKKTESGPPMITAVRLIDTTKRDSTFTEAVPGTEIVIEGANMGGLQAVYFNDTAANFNPVYATSSNIIVVIPSTSQTAATNPNVPSEIKIVTNHGTATYKFTLYLYPPTISAISFNDAGTAVTITGTNFEGIQKITFPISGGGADTALSYTVNSTFTSIVAQIPPGSPFQDSLRVYCTWGIGSYSYPPPMTITGVSNENAIAGTTITVTGTNLIGIDKVIFPGGIQGTNFQSISATQFTVTVPSGITAPDTLRISGVLGNASATQLFDSYITAPSPGYLSTFEVQWPASGTPNDSWLGWTGTGVAAATAATTYPGATGAVSQLTNAGPMSANIGCLSQANAGTLQLNSEPWVANTGASISGYSMKFEVNVPNSWTMGEIWIAVGGWYGWNNYTARYAPWSTSASGSYQTNGWVTVTIPLTQFIQGNQYWTTSWTTGGAPANTFNDYPSTAVGFLVTNDMAVAVPVGAVNIAIDNVRIVQGQ
jgi:hypothetical protein